MKRKILILGGTTEARILAARLGADLDLDVILSLAGRTAEPGAQPVPVRIGGFGGVDGLAAYLTAERIDALIVATHPYAATIATHAAIAAQRSGIAAIQLERAPWQRHAGDDWSDHPTLDALVDAIGPARRRVFVTIGRQGVRAFERAPHHAYLIRSVDPVEPRLVVQDAAYILDRGPYDIAAEIALMRRHGIEILVTKNSGGAATFAKIEAARQLDLPVMLLARPPQADLPRVDSIEAVEAWLAHDAPHGVVPAKRGE